MENATVVSDAAPAAKEILMSGQLTMPSTPSLSQQALPLQQSAVMAAEPAPVSADTYAALINLSCRRRFAAQRVVLFAVLASLGHEGADASARATLAQLREAHADLVDGRGMLPGAAGGPLHEAYFGTLQGDRTVRDFLGLAAQALDAIAGNGTGAPALLDQLIRSATPLLSVLNGLTLMLEEQARRHAQARRLRLQHLLDQLRAASLQAGKLAFHAQVVAARAHPGGGDGTALATAMAGVAEEMERLLAEAQGQVRGM
jgi:hypothetical protein